MTISALKQARRLLFVLMGCCTTAGTGFGTTGATLISFDRPSTESVSGTMHANAVLPDGKTYSGRFSEVTTHMTVDNLWPLWSGWGPGYRGRGGWDGPPEFVIHYTGRVVADLGAPNGGQMRCQFPLMHPSYGMVSCRPQR